MRRSFCLLLILAIGGVASAGDEKIIHGVDNRVDVFESKNLFYKTLAKSTAAMVERKVIVPFNQNGKLGYKYDAGTLVDEGICKDQRFAFQKAVSVCSGFLVAPNLLVTAGHCVVTQEDCDKYDWVFDFKMNDAQTLNQPSANTIYQCKKIISRVLDNETWDDYALLELDRSVVGRNPLKFRKHGTIQRGDQVLIIGHPSGLPSKIADGAIVRSVESTYFSTNLDAFGGNSGSAVFNATTGEVEGILVRGDEDYIKNPNGDDCKVNYVVTDEGGDGEDVTYITNIKELNDI